jgi:hypothetical protein
MVFENGLALHELEWFDEQVHPGHNMSVAFIWQAEPGAEVNLNDLRYELDVIAPGGEVVRTLSGRPAGGAVDQLAAGTAVRELAAIYFPPEGEPGRYRLWWRLFEGEEVVRGRPSWRPWFSQNVLDGSLNVAPWPMETTLPKDVTVEEAQLGPSIQLYGYKMGEVAEDQLSLTLYWLATGVPDESYLTFVHLVNAAGGELESQVDRVPVNDLRPTSGWRPGEVLEDQLTLALPEDLAPGEYAVNAGMYNPDDGQRLPLTVEGRRAPNDQINLETVTLP